MVVYFFWFGFVCLWDVILLCWGMSILFLFSSPHTTQQCCSGVTVVAAAARPTYYPGTCMQLLLAPEQCRTKECGQHNNNKHSCQTPASRYAIILFAIEAKCKIQHLLANFLHDHPVYSVPSFSFITYLYIFVAIKDDKERK